MFQENNWKLKKKKKTVSITLGEKKSWSRHKEKQNEQRWSTGEREKLRRKEEEHNFDHVTSSGYWGNEKYKIFLTSQFAAALPWVLPLSAFDLQESHLGHVLQKYTLIKKEERVKDGSGGICFYRLSARCLAFLGIKHQFSGFSGFPFPAGFCVCLWMR